ncbi:MAG TPA: hypothetical protein PK668_03075 [Myxococcota bacterium]|nr:hypothetical protein [Myxococcota bacterium]HRY91836.1 hypothetical protein [Myxococcota bacterium]HSA21911.1 hypothetical protein [Myxococcota bacterium]
MVDVAYLRTLPSYLKGSTLQTLATLVPPARFEARPPRPVVLVPGAFCTASVMNWLGRRMQAHGGSVAVAPTFPFYVAAAANLCRLEQAVDRFLPWLDELGGRLGVEEVDVAGHSNGGLIALLAHDRVARGEASCRVRLRRVVTMATPFRGFPGARALSPMLPCCRDLIPGAEALARAERASHLVVRCLVATHDSLIPPDSQYVDMERRTLMEGYQHMDYIVGPAERIEQAATEVLRWLDS